MYRWGIIFLLCACALAASDRRVLLRDIPTLLFEAGKTGTSFRTAAVPQLRQVAGAPADVPHIRCLNRGFDGKDVIWECAPADGVPARLGKFAISCEGYDAAGDPYVLAGSCGIEYELLPPAAPRAGAESGRGKAESTESVKSLFIHMAFLSALSLLTGLITAFTIVIMCLKIDMNHNFPSANPAAPAAPAAAPPPPPPPPPRPPAAAGGAGEGARAPPAPRKERRAAGAARRGLEQRVGRRRGRRVVPVRPRARAVRATHDVEFKPVRRADHVGGQVALVLMQYLFRCVLWGWYVRCLRWQCLCMPTTGASCCAMSAR